MTIDVILLEDDPSKKDRLLKFLGNNSQLFGRVDTATCVNSARRLMIERHYDLLLADIIVPEELGAHDKSEKYSIALFEELDEGFGDIQRPTYILPISNSNDLPDAAHDFFRGRPWGILHYSNDSDECIETVLRVASFIVKEKGDDAEDRTCDVFVITALIEPEFSAVESLGFNWGPLEPLDSKHLVRFGEFFCNGVPHKVAAGFCSRMGPVAASILTTKALIKLKPKLVIMAGICAGVPGKADIGDVVAVDTSWDWQSGKYVDKNGVEAFEIAPHQLNASEVEKSQLHIFRRELSFWKQFSDDVIKLKISTPKLVIGPMATGSSVLADSRVADRIRTNQHKNVVGLDMETYGVFAAVNSADSSATAMSMKAVCDKGDRQKNDEYQPYASHVSAKAVEYFLVNHFHRLNL